MMSFVSTWLLSTLLGIAPVAGAAEPASGAMSPEATTSSVSKSLATRREQAFKLYTAGRYTEAALEFEALWGDSGDSRYLYNAASSRFAVGHFAHAADYLARYLETPGLAADDRGDASGQLAAARGHLVPVLFNVRGSAEGASLTIEHVPKLVSDVRPALKVRTHFDDEGGQGKIGLDPARWRLRLKTVEGREVVAEVEIHKGTPAQVFLEIPKAIAPQDPPQSPEMRPHLLGFGVGGGGLALVGLGLTVGSSIRADRLLTGNETCSQELDKCRLRIVRSLNARTWGSGLVGLGIGAAAGGLTGLIQDSRRRRIAWIAEAATGGVLLLAGTTSVILGARGASEFSAPSNTEGGSFTSWSSTFTAEGAGSASLHSVGGLLLGLGGGLGSSALTALLLQRKSKTSRGAKAQIDVGASPQGLVLRGSF